MVRNRLHKRPSPVSLRLNDEERAVLARRAGNLPLSTYIKSELFPEHSRGIRRAASHRSVDKAELAKILAMLGSSRLTGNLALLADDARYGNLIDDARTAEQICNACYDIGVIRETLMRAVGKTDVADDSTPPNPYDVSPICHSFLTHAELQEARNDT